MVKSSFVSIFKTFLKSPSRTLDGCCTREKALLDKTMNLSTKPVLYIVHQSCAAERKLALLAKRHNSKVQHQFNAEYITTDSPSTDFV